MIFKLKTIIFNIINIIFLFFKTIFALKCLNLIFNFQSARWLIKYVVMH